MHSKTAQSNYKLSQLVKSTVSKTKFLLILKSLLGVC
jgi:hypothetical protein